MGKGTIRSAMGGGKYRVELNYNRARMTARLAKLATLIPWVLQQVIDAEAALIPAENELKAALQALNALVAADPVSEAGQAAIRAQMKVVTEKRTALEAKQRTLSATRLWHTSLVKEEEMLNSVPADPVVEAWCADYSQSLSGIVGTIEIPGERTALQIQPGHSGAAAYNQSRDGQLQPSQASTPAGIAWNWAMLPGWQKWKPTYRHGTITAIEDQKCSITLDAATSSAKNLNVNQVATLSDVPFDYMTCDEAAFTVDDRVLVRFTGQDIAQPVVIGFAENPRPCPEGIYCVQFEKAWRDTWVSGPITASDMFARTYFKIDPATSEPFWISREAAESEASLSDAWTVTPWREWVPDTTYVGNCQYASYVATQRERCGALDQFIIAMPNGREISIVQNEAGIYAWSPANVKTVWAHLGPATRLSTIGIWQDAAWQVRGYFPTSYGWSDTGGYLTFFYRNHSDNLWDISGDSFMVSHYPDWPYWNGIHAVIHTGSDSEWRNSPIFGSPCDPTQFFPSGWIESCQHVMVESEDLITSDDDVYRTNENQPARKELGGWGIVFSDNDLFQIGKSLHFRMENGVAGSYVLYSMVEWITASGNVPVRIKIVIDSSGIIIDTEHLTHGSMPTGTTNVIYDNALEIMDYPIIKARLWDGIPQGLGGVFEKIFYMIQAKNAEIAPNGPAMDLYPWAGSTNGWCRLLNK